MRVGHLTYVNALPLYSRVSAELISGNPAELNSMLSRGELDVSLISSVEYLRHKERYELLPQFGIAAEGRVESVKLYVKEPVTEIALTPQSASSAELVKLLCNHFWNIQPQFVSLPNVEEATCYSAFLLIGDQALLHPKFAGYRSIDLANEWYEKTRLPMTFALFAKRKGIDTAHFEEEVDASLRWSEEHREQMIEIARTRSHLPISILQSYYPLLRYRLGEREHAGLRTFEALCQQRTQFSAK